MSTLKYKKGYKYQLQNDLHIQTGIEHPLLINTRFIDLDLEGNLLIKQDYCWDGPSGPTIDTENFMRGSLVHDALYQLMRMNLLPLRWRDHCDQLLRQICIEDGMSWIRAWWVYRALYRFGEDAALPENQKILYVIAY